MVNSGYADRPVHSPRPEPCAPPAAKPGPAWGGAGLQPL